MDALQRVQRLRRRVERLLYPGFAEGAPRGRRVLPVAGDVAAACGRVSLHWYGIEVDGRVVGEMRELREAEAELERCAEEFEANVRRLEELAAGIATGDVTAATTYADEFLRGRGALVLAALARYARFAELEAVCDDLVRLTGERIEVAAGVLQAKTVGTKRRWFQLDPSTWLRPIDWAVAVTANAYLLNLPTNVALERLEQCARELEQCIAQAGGAARIRAEAALADIESL